MKAIAALGLLASPAATLEVIVKPSDEGTIEFPMENAVDSAEDALAVLLTPRVEPPDMADRIQLTGISVKEDPNASFPISIGKGQTRTVVVSYSVAANAGDSSFRVFLDVLIPDQIVMPHPESWNTVVFFVIDSTAPAVKITAAPRDGVPMIHGAFKGQTHSPSSPLWLNNVVQFSDPPGEPVGITFEAHDLTLSTMTIGFDDPSKAPVWTQPSPGSLNPVVLDTKVLPDGIGYNVSAHDKLGQYTTVHFAIDSIRPGVAFNIHVSTDLALTAVGIATDSTSGIWSVGVETGPSRSPPLAAPPDSKIKEFSAHVPFHSANPQAPSAFVVARDLAGLSNPFNSVAFNHAMFSGRGIPVDTPLKGRWFKPGEEAGPSISGNVANKVVAVRCESTCGSLELYARSTVRPMTEPVPGVVSLVHTNEFPREPVRVFPPLPNATPLVFGATVEFMLVGGSDAEPGGHLVYDLETVFGDARLGAPVVTLTPKLAIRIPSGPVEVVVNDVEPGPNNSIGAAPATAPPPTGYRNPPAGASIYDIYTNANYSGPVEISLPFSSQGLSAQQASSVRMFHFEDQSWVDVTERVDVAAGRVHGRADHFSLFGVFVSTDVLPPDRAPPVTNLNAEGQVHVSTAGETFISAATPIALHAQDDDSGVEAVLYAIDPSTELLAQGLNAQTRSLFTVYTVPFQLPAGRRAVAYGAVDRDGNFETLKVSSFSVDGAAPTLTLAIIGRSAHVGSLLAVAAGSSVTLSAVDPDSGGVVSDLAGIRYLVDISPDSCPEAEPIPTEPAGTCANPDYAGPFTLSTGTHSLAYVSADNVGNVSEFGFQDVLVDDVLPVVLFQIEESSVVARYFDEGAGVSTASIRLLLNGTDVTGNAVILSTAAILLELSPGAYTLDVSLQDRVGNATEASRSFTVAGAFAVAASLSPETINRKSSGRFVTVSLESAEPLDPASLRIVAVNGGALSAEIPALTKPAPSTTDADANGIPELVAKFERDALIAVLPVGDQVAVRFAGRAQAGTAFTAEALVRAIEPGTVKSLDGGAVIHPLTGAKVEFPPTALGRDTEVTVARLTADDGAEERRRSEAAATAALEPKGKVFEFGPEGATFAQPVVLSLPYDPKELGNVSPSDLKIAYWNPRTGAWEPLESTVDPFLRAVKARTNHFSQYQIVAPASGNGGGTPPAASDEFSLGEVYAYPNPTRPGQRPSFKIEAPGAESLTLTIYDVSGQRVLQASPVPGQDYAWETGNVGTGVFLYIVQARRGGETISKRGKVAVIK